MRRVRVRAICQDVERDRAIRDEFARTPEAQRRAVLKHGPSEHRTYVRTRPERDGRSRRTGRLLEPCVAFVLVALAGIARADCPVTGDAATCRPWSALLMPT